MPAFHNLTRCAPQNVDLPGSIGKGGPNGDPLMVSKLGTSTNRDLGLETEA